MIAKCKDCGREDEHDSKGCIEKLKAENIELRSYTDKLVYSDVTTPRLIKENQALRELVKKGQQWMSALLLFEETHGCETEIKSRDWLEKAKEILG